VTDNAAIHWFTVDVSADSNLSTPQ